MHPDRSRSRLHSWASIIEPDTLAQAEQTASMPFVFPHVALMPDAHLGKGATVGSVIPTLGAIIPAAVGVDIGCGMVAHRTTVHVDQTAGLDRRALREAIEQAIPLSAGKYNQTLYDERTDERVDELSTYAETEGIDLLRFAPNWMLQLGSLGSGNHFIEVSTDQDGYLWLFLHSGSRGVGNKIAQHFIAVATEQCRRRFIGLPDPDLAYLVEGEPEFEDYMKHLRWAQHFALLNREEMMARVEDCFRAWFGDFEVTQAVNCHHNYTYQERHFGEQVWVSRKGAISAESGEWGLIPGSMGTRSYVVQGKGNRLSLNSAPHGAGREYSRSKARKTFTVEDLRARMEGIEYRDTEAFVDEIPDAYKNIDQVMADAADLVEVRFELAQIINVKGD